MQLQQLISCAPAQVKDSFVYRSHSAGSSIIFQGESNHYLYILLDGCADVVIQSASGATVTLHSYKAYSCFGEVELFNRHIKTCNIVVRSCCQTISIPQRYVFEWMQSDFEFTKHLIEQLSDKLIQSSVSLANLSILDVKDRLLNNLYAHHLIGDLAKITKRQVCEESCIPIRSMNRSLAECKNSGYVDFRNKQFCILSFSKFEEYCRNLNVV